MVDNHNKILIVDDEMAHIELIKRIINSNGNNYEIIDATNLQELRSVLKSTSPDMLLMDINLPDGSAFDFLESTSNLAFPVLIMTAYGNEKIVVRAIKAGALDYVVKTEQNLADLPRVIERSFREWDNIQSRIEVEQTLSRSEKKYKTIIETTSDGFWQTTLDGYLLEVNQSYCNMSGYSKEELIGMHISKIDSNDEDLELVKQRAEWLMKNDGGSFESLHRRKDRTFFNVEITSNFIQENEGCFFVFVRDITERKRHEEMMQFVAQRAWIESGEDFFTALVKYLGKITGLDYVLIDKLTENAEIAETIALYAKGSVVPNMQYNLKDTPCSNVIGKSLCAYSKNVQKLFPYDSLLCDMEAESYIGIPLWDSEGNAIGLIAFIDSKPLQEAESLSSLLQMVANRVSSEMERMNNEQILIDAKERAEESESRYRNIFESSPISIWEEDFSEVKTKLDELKSNGISDFETYFDENPHEIGNLSSLVKVINVNEASIKLLGLTNPDDLYIKLPDFFNEESLKVFKKEIIDLANGAKTFESEIQILDAKGEKRILDLKLAVQTGYEDNLSSVIVSFVDITEKKKANQSIVLAKIKAENSEERFRSLFENMLNGFAFCKLIYKDDVPVDYTYINVNRAFEKQTGLKNVIGKRVTDFLPDILKNDPETFDLYNRVAQTGKPEWNEIFLKSLGKWFSLAVYSPQKEYFVAIFDDISDRKKYEEALKESEKRFRSLVESAYDAIYLLKGRQYIYINPRFTDMTGYSESELLSSDFDFHCMMSARSIEFMENRYTARMNGETISNQYEIEIIRKDQNIVEVEVTTVVIEDEPELVVLGIMRDITERKKIEEELIKSKMRAEESDKLKSSFLQNMSHEIRTPLNGIMGFSSLLKDFDDLTSEEIHEYIELIVNSSNRLLGIVDDVLHISRIDTGMVNVNRSIFSISEIVHYLTALYSQKIKDKELKFVISFKDEYLSLSLNSDKEKIYQIISNLFNNAIKFTDKGELEFGCRYDNQELSFFLRDTGIGIDKEFYNTIFERFWQYEALSSRKFGGTGLGLSISKALADLLGARISLESESGIGSIFTLTFSSDSIIQTVGKDNTIHQKGTDLNLDLTGLKILVAEDEETNYFYIESILRLKKANIVWVMNGQSAIDKALNDTFDLILMDIKMPLLDGLEATRKIKAVYPDLPIIAQTAYSHDDERILALNAGCDDYVTKPFSKLELYYVIQRVLEKR